MTSQTCDDFPFLTPRRWKRRGVTDRVMDPVSSIRVKIFNKSTSLYEV